MVKHTLTIRWQQPMYWLNVLDHFVVLALKMVKKENVLNLENKRCRTDTIIGGVLRTLSNTSKILCFAKIVHGNSVLNTPLIILHSLWLSSQLCKFFHWKKQQQKKQWGNNSLLELRAGSKGLLHRIKLEFYWYL